jgi:hypothetical protein
VSGLQSWLTICALDCCHCLAVVLLVLSSSKNPSLSSFQKEAEKAIGKPIKVVYYQNAGPEGGQTDCASNPVEIKIRTGFTSELQDLLLAHELGHVIVCSRNIEIVIYTIPTAPPLAKPILVGLSSLIMSCYIDPLANSEAEKRGFNLDKLADSRIKYMGLQSKRGLRAMVNDQGEFSRDFAALSLYCMGILDKKTSPEMEAAFADELPVLHKLESLKTNMGTPSCTNLLDCYYWTKKLRDQFSWSEYLRMKNPSTEKME